MDARGEGTACLLVPAWPAGRDRVVDVWPAPPHVGTCAVQGLRWAGSPHTQVKHLEVSSASMAEDLCRKSAIIETYVMDSRIGQCLLPSPPHSSSLSPAPSFPTIRCPGFCPLLLEPSKVLTRPQPAEGRAGQARTCVFFFLFCLILAPPSPLGLCHLSTLLSLVRLCLFLLSSPCVSCSSLSPFSLLCAPTPFILSHRSSLYCPISRNFLYMCITLGFLSLPHLFPSSLLFLPSPLSSFSPLLFLLPLSFKPSSLLFFFSYELE